MAASRKVAILAILGIGIWWAFVVAGFAHLSNFGFTPGEAETAPAGWPAESAIERRPGRPTLVLFAHPHCPCSSASLEELDRLLAAVGREVATTILFVSARGTPDGWERTRLWEAARRIPGVSVLVDRGGEESRRFRARTSGAVVVYDAGGRLLFSGGITASRGHSGANAGRSAIEALLAGGSVGRAEAPVFGCPLDSPAESETTPPCRK